MAKQCCHCGTDKKELRPYGPNGAWVCFGCAMSPEHKLNTETQYSIQLEAAGPVAVIGEYVGPYPLERRDDGK